MTFLEKDYFMELIKEDPGYNKPLDPLGKSIDILNIILNKCPQHRYVNLRYVFWARNISIVFYVSLILFGLAKMWFSHYIPTPFVLISTAIFFILGGCFEFSIIHIKKLQQEIINRWSNNVIETAITICSLGQRINENQRDRLYTLVTSKEKELDIAFKECDESGRVVYQRLLTIANPN